MKIVTVLGARPQFIKAGSISREFSAYEDIKEVIVHTGQHYDTNMSDVFFDEMKIPKPDYFLGIGGKSHAEMTGLMLIEIEKILIQEKPDFLLVYGDTNSTLAGALAAAKIHIKIIHIEAGLRSYNMNMPEEINRIITDRLSSLLFCPTQQAVKNLKKEGFLNNKNTQIIRSGDIMYDGALFYQQFMRKPKIEKDLNNYVLCTIHRAENTDNTEKLCDIFRALDDISLKYHVVLPLHPRTKLKLEQIKYDFGKSNIIFVSPVGYLEMVWLLSNCSSVITDSGGLQKEAFFFGKPCITLRDETEWIELVENGCNVLVGSNYYKIIKSFTHLGLEACDFNSSLYGDGSASKIIVKKIREYFNRMSKE